MKRALAAAGRPRGKSAAAAACALYAVLWLGSEHRLNGGRIGTTRGVRLLETFFVGP